MEIDESKFGKRKYNRGHRVEGVWVLGGVERTDQQRLFLEVVESRDTATLLEVIRRKVHPESIVHTDCWAAYNALQSLGYTHRTVNHSNHFVSPEGVHTNTIEGNAKAHLLYWTNIVADLKVHGPVSKLVFRRVMTKY